MGCISSKFLATNDLDLDHKISTHHVVSLTSTTYGVLNLNRSEEKAQEEAKEEKKESQITKVNKISPLPPPYFTPQSKKRALSADPQEIINTWELMKDLSPAVRPSAKCQTPELTDSPKKQRTRLLGKENSSPRENHGRVLRPFSSSANRQPSKLSIDVKCQKLEKDLGSLGSRRSLSPLFDPELVASFERELNRDGAPVSQKARDSRILLEKFKEKCPAGGENALVLYTTTLRGIRKTFEDCNAVRTAIEAYNVKIIERDISMDSGFREEMRELMGGKKEARPPLLFVKGRLIGGAEEVLKLEEEGKLELLLDGIAKMEASGCGVCGGGEVCDVQGVQWELQGVG